MKRKGLFITGTDTDVGKTYITTQIIRQLQSIAVSIKVRKPIESGCLIQSNGQLHPADGFSLWQANNKQESLDIVTPYRFEPAIAPNRAATLSKKSINTEQLKNACLINRQENDFLIVEGAGGFYSPLTHDGLNADLAAALNLNIILIVKDQLGCINHTLLTLEAIKNRNLNCVGIILNDTSPDLLKRYNHKYEIQVLTHLNVYECLHDGKLEDMITLLSPNKH